ncbi:hypothetical protein B0T21DRAFT_363169 [Apiosordaria backusii]|uniref:Secreted protein n=1 Tax=Apiosordaria backusii TaxID=314023 RepID=A0AA40EI91_9PEZI|nr:hypothetical protein B0T21DRAFT_363169 [Apiosordaria backusii]
MYGTSCTYSQTIWLLSLFLHSLFGPSPPEMFPCCVKVKDMCTNRGRPPFSTHPRGTPWGCLSPFLFLPCLTLPFILGVERAADPALWDHHSPPHRLPLKQRS